MRDMSGNRMDNSTIALTQYESDLLFHKFWIQDLHPLLQNASQREQ